MTRGWLVAVAGAALAVGCSRIDVGAQRYVCVPDGGLDSQQCPGDWRCALDGFCVNPALGAELRCEATADCTGGWKCTRLGQCADPDAGKDLPCLTRDDCTGGWQCSLEQRCVDPTVGRALRCGQDVDCTAGWKCTREGECADPDAGKELPCLSSADCTAGWHCGALGRCYDRLDAGALSCRRDAGVDDCAPQWRCGVDLRCQDTRVAAPYACQVDEHCEQGWRCAPEARCVDPRADALRPTGDAGLRIAELDRLFPPGPVAVAVGVGSGEVCGRTYGLRSATSVGDAGWVRLLRPDDDTGFPVSEDGGCGLREDQRYGIAWSRPSPGDVVALADHVDDVSTTYALLADGGLLRWDTQRDQPVGTLTQVSTVVVPTLMRWSSVRRGVLVLANDVRVSTLQLDGGQSAPSEPLPEGLVDVVEVDTGALGWGPRVVVAGSTRVFVQELPSTNWVTGWLAPDSSSTLNGTFALGPARIGTSGFSYLRQTPDGGVEGGVAIFGGGNATRPSANLHYDCDPNGVFDLGAAVVNGELRPRTRVDCVTADRLHLAFDETATPTAPHVGPLPPGYADAVKGRSLPGTVAWALPSGAVAAWGGTTERPTDVDELSVLNTVPSALLGNSTAPVVTVDTPLGGANAVCRLQGSLGLVCARSQLPVAAVARARPELALVDFSGVEANLPPLLVVNLDETSRFDRARIVAQRNEAFGPPFTLAARAEPDGGVLLLASSNDTLLFAQTDRGQLASSLDTMTDFLALPRLTYATVPQSRAPITSSVLLPRSAASAQLFAEAYVVAAGRVYRVQADNPVVWRAQEVLPVTAEAISVWSDGPRVRVSFRDGTVYSLPSRLPVAPPLLAGASSVVDLADACGQTFALSRKGLFRLESDGSPMGRWARVTLPDFTEAELGDGKLFADPQGLLVFLPEGRVLRVDGQRCLP